MGARIESARIGAALAFIGALVVVSASRTETNARWVTASPCLNLRQQPEQQAPVERCVPSGVKVDVVGSAPDWQEVELSDGTRGWVAERYLSREEPAQREPTTSNPPVRAVSPMSDLEPAVPRQAFVEVAPFEPLSGDTVSVVSEGVFRRRELLTGELVPTRATPIVVPRTRSWNVQIQWMAEDGSEVAPGDTLIEFDNSGLASQLEDLKVSVVESAESLSRAKVEGDALGAEKIFALEQARIELEKARLEASVPAELLSRREFQDRQLALRRAEIAFVKAQEDLEAHRTTNQANIEIKRVALGKSLREIAQIESDLDSLSSKAPEHGFALIENHPWEGRKFAVGDTLWPGMTVLTLPDLASLRVEARLIDVDDGKIEVGMPAICRLDAYPANAYACRVEEITPVAQADSARSLRRTFKARLELERTDLGTMRPGMSVSVEVESRRLEDVLLAPRSGLDLTTKPAHAILAGGQAVEVELGPCNAQQCVVVKGVSSGQRLRRGEIGDS